VTCIYLGTFTRFLLRSKSVSYAVWYPDLARAHVTVARGVHFTSMGHSVQRPSKVSMKAQKRLELLPEEALYLVEKGALFCWRASHDSRDEDASWDSASQGAPMSVQQAYAEMIGTQDLTLDRYHVKCMPLVVPFSIFKDTSSARRSLTFGGWVMS
jgi:tRNA-splicing endonuclease subunit Sen54